MTTLDTKVISTNNESASVRQWAMIIHLSQLAGYLVPVAGFVAPIVVWQVKKDEYPELDKHGREVANWLISFVIYFCAAMPLVLLLIGLPLIWALGVIGMIYPIIGGIKANQGEFWHYPGAIQFFKQKQLPPAN